MVFLRRIPNPYQTLLKQPRTVTDLERLHSRYASYEFCKHLPRDELLQTRDIQDNENFSVIKSVGGLISAANFYSNCVHSYVWECLTGDFVIAEYKSASENGLLQLDFSHGDVPLLQQFLGPDNCKMSEKAWEHAKKWHIELLYSYKGMLA